MTTHHPMEKKTVTATDTTQPPPIQSASRSRSTTTEAEQCQEDKEEQVVSGLPRIQGMPGIPEIPGVPKSSSHMSLNPSVPVPTTEDLHYNKQPPPLPASQDPVPSQVVHPPARTTMAHERQHNNPAQVTYSFGSTDLRTRHGQVRGQTQKKSCGSPGGGKGSRGGKLPGTWLLEPSSAASLRRSMLSWIGGGEVVRERERRTGMKREIGEAGQGQTPVFGAADGQEKGKPPPEIDREEPATQLEESERESQPDQDHPRDPVA